jgi:hypothetical protein
MLWWGISIFWCLVSIARGDGILSQFRDKIAGVLGKTNARKVVR